MKCCNDKCQNDPSDSAREIIVNCDGDSVCNNKCEVEYEKQKDHFFSVVINDDKKFNAWMNN